MPFTLPCSRECRPPRTLLGFCYKARQCWSLGGSSGLGSSHVPSAPWTAESKLSRVLLGNHVPRPEGGRRDGTQALRRKESYRTTLPKRPGCISYLSLEGASVSSIHFILVGPSVLAITQGWWWPERFPVFFTQITPVLSPRLSASFASTSKSSHCLQASLRTSALSSPCHPMSTSVPST